MKLSAILFTTLSLVVFNAIPAAAQDSQEGPIGRFLDRFRPTHAVQVHNHPVAPEAAPVTQYVDETGAVVMVAEPAPAPAAAPVTGWEGDGGGGGDPSGFIGVLNRIRASAGLHPVAYDSNLASWARRNNAAQCALGLGHHVNPAAAQNCAWNYSTADEAAAGWMNSPGHRENMLSPSITHVGVAFGPGPYWTLNAR